MPNKPRPENRHRMVRVEDELWGAAEVACAKLGTTRAAIMRAALVQAVKEAGRDRRGQEPMNRIPSDINPPVHVVPTSDQIEHDLGDTCACGPTVEPVGRADGSTGWIVTHHSLDGRESSEPIRHG